MTYQAPIDDLKFGLSVHGKLDEILTLSHANELDKETVFAILEEAGKFSEAEWAESNVIGDKNGAKFINGTVETDSYLKNVYSSYIEAGWNSIRSPQDFGGQELPTLVGAVTEELFYSGNMALSLLPMLTNGAVTAIYSHATEELKKLFLEKMISGHWSGTMNLTEPQAGSDLALLSSKAIPNDDGTYDITGQKIFITWGEHDLAENIIHLVLARLPDAKPGVKGISMFIVPKFWVNNDGSLGEKNTVELVSIEHKLGIHASPTCVLQFNQAKGYLVGEAGAGLAYMFTMMNHARLGVGIEALAVSERAFQVAKSYANERIQSRDITSTDHNSVAIIHHPDIKRMLLVQKATIEAQRALYLLTSAALDNMHYHPDESERKNNAQLVEFMIPIVKGFCTENSTTLTNLAIQVFGGMGYIEETGVAQFSRDARITPIYEGTSGIQALDLIGRKTAKNEGEVAYTLIQNATLLVNQLKENGKTDLANLLTESLELAKESIDYIIKTYNSSDIAKAATGSLPFLMQISTTFGAVEMAKAYIAAQNALNNLSQAELSELFYKNKLATVDVYFHYVLPHIHTYAKQVKHGSESILSFDISKL